MPAQKQAEDSTAKENVLLTECDGLWKSRQEKEKKRGVQDGRRRRRRSTTSAMRYIADDMSASNTVEEMNERHNSNQGSLFDFRKKTGQFWKSCGSNEYLLNPLRGFKQTHAQILVYSLSRLEKCNFEK